MRSFRIIGLFVCLMALSACQTTQQAAEAEENQPAYDPNKTAELNLKLGIGHIREGNNEVALKKLKRAVELDPAYPDAHSVLGLLYQRLGQNTLAEQHLKRAIQLQPNSSSGLNNYGQFLCSRGRPEEAAAMFLRAVENPLYDTPELAYTNAGLCAYKNDKLEVAEQQFRQALQQNPRVVPALLHMAHITYKKQKYLSARGYLQRYLELAKHTAESLWLGIRVERELGDRDTQSSYELLLRANYPDSREVMLLDE